MRFSTIPVNFQDLLDGLRRHIATRIAGGEMTERGLARRAGISQPHLHNVLKGVRSMTPDVADRLLATLSLSVGDIEVSLAQEAGYGREEIVREAGRGLG